MIKSKTIDDCMELSKQIGFPFTTLEVFIVDCLHWLKKEFEDIHIEYHKDTGWQVSSCYADESWDGWISGDGTLITALYEAVKAGLKQKNKKL